MFFLVERIQALSGDAQFVADRQADAFSPKIEGENFHASRNKRIRANTI